MYTAVSVLLLRNRAFAAGLFRRMFGDEGYPAFNALRKALTLPEQDPRPTQIRCVQHLGYLIFKDQMPQMPLDTVLSLTVRRHFLVLRPTFLRS